MGDRHDGRLRPEAEALNEVILATFRTNGLLLSAGDRLSAPEGLTSARWQVLGAIALAHHPLTVPQIARRMGLTRQSVRATTNRLVADGLVALVPNADHRRSPLVNLTASGTVAYQAMEARQEGWADRLVEGFELSDLETTARMLGELGVRLEAQLRDQRGDDACAD
jgi:DNA-binding MarR family transcriptional regulator